MNKEYLLFGFDISLEHWGITCISSNTGNLIGSWSSYTTPKWVVDTISEIKYTGIQSPIKKENEQKAPFTQRRIHTAVERIQCLIKSILFDYSVIGYEKDDFFISIEGYSYQSQTTSICQIAELTGTLKHKLLEMGAKIRVHDPSTLKQFGANLGNAKKIQMLDAARTKGFLVPDSIIKPVKKAGIFIDVDGPGTDIIDAWFLAHMLYMELQLRDGRIIIDELDKIKQKIFRRISTYYPVDLMHRTFIEYCPSGDPL